MVEMLGAVFLGVGTMFPGMELMIVAHIAVRVGDGDLIGVERVVRIGRTKHRHAPRQGECRNYHIHTHIFLSCLLN